MRDLYKELGENFAWKEPPYEYEYDRTPIDFINGGDFLRNWVERQGCASELDSYEQQGHQAYLDMREESLLYRS
jgi:hypothetical protein